MDISTNNNGGNNVRTQQVHPNPSLPPPSSTSIADNVSPLSPSAAGTTQPCAFSPTTPLVPPLQQNDSENTAESPRDVENAIQHSTHPPPPPPPPPPVGYNHSKVIMTSPVACATYKLLSWLQDMSQSKTLITFPFSKSAFPQTIIANVVPRLPVVGDPVSLLNFYELNTQLSSSSSFSSSSDDLSQNPNSRHFRDVYIPEFRTLAFDGDLALKFHSNSIILEVFGDCRMIEQRVCDDWLSNATWNELAMLYRLDEYVGWFPKSLRGGGHSGDRDKFWADIWEAWWACCFSEREIWGDNIDDLISFLRRIIELKYWGLVERYSTCKQPYQEESSIHRPVSDGENEQVPVREVQRGDNDICEWLGPASPKQKNEFLGYLATIPFDISIYSEDREIAVSIALLYSKYGYRDTVSPKIISISIRLEKESILTCLLSSQQSRKLRPPEFIQFISRNMFR